MDVHGSLSIDIIGGTALTKGTRVRLEQIPPSGVRRLAPAPNGDWIVQSIAPFSQSDPEKGQALDGVRLTLRRDAPSR